MCVELHLDMQSVICRGCTKQLSSSDGRVDIFSNDTLDNLREDGETNATPTENKITKLYLGIELIVGVSISKTDGLPHNLCTECHRKLDAFIAFREQLMTSVQTLLKLKLSEEKSGSTLDLKDEETTASEPKAGDELKNAKSVKLTEDLICIDENTMTPEIDRSINKASISNRSSISAEAIDQENNNLNESNSSSENSEMAYGMVREHVRKYQDNDVESDIDVCSGDDDEILELDVQCKKDEIYEIGSSSESDIEVCDYEPIGKKFKTYGTLFPSLEF